MSFCSCVFSPFGVAITSLGEERARLGAFRTFVRFALVWICRFPLPFGVWEGLWFVILALPGLFSYPFFNDMTRQYNSILIYVVCKNLLISPVAVKEFSETRFSKISEWAQ